MIVSIRVRSHALAFLRRRTPHIQAGAPVLGSCGIHDGLPEYPTSREKETENPGGSSLLRLFSGWTGQQLPERSSHSGWNPR